jgi:hypothetical protein
VTSIASFRVLTDGGKIGASWPPGDSAAFAAALHRAIGVPRQIQSQRAVEFFHEHLSYAAIARAAITAYSDLAMKRVEIMP